MMRTIDLRHKIIEYVSHIEDDSFLEELKKTIESNISGATYKLSEFQKSRIKSARQQLKDKQTISHEDLQKEIDQWLNSK
jgi:hypothetical protein